VETVSFQKIHRLPISIFSNLVTVADKYLESKEHFLKKIQFCSQIFDFNDNNKMIAEKNERLKYISELSDLLTNQHHVINLVIPHLDRVMEMI